MICTYKEIKRRNPPRKFRVGEYFTGMDGKTYCVTHFESGTMYGRRIFSNLRSPIPVSIIPR